MNLSNETWGLGDLIDDAPVFDPCLEDLEAGSEIFLPATLPERGDAPEPAYKSTISQWPAELPMALALGVDDIPAILKKYHISPERFELLKPVPAFRKALSDAMREVREHGHTFRAKAAAIAEDFLETLDGELHNPSVGLSTKVDVFKYLTKVGNLEPKPEAPTQNQANTVNIQINL